MLSETEILKLIHELEVHQTELEMQNNELLKSRENEKLASEKYIELYDFAPSGIFSLSKEGEIIDLNLTGAKILGKDQQQLKGSRFGFFVTDETKPVFSLFLKKVIENRVKEYCEVILLSDNDTKRYVQLFGITDKNGEQCLLTLNDITEGKQAGQLLQESEIKYRSLVETAQELIWRCDASGRFTYLNPTWEKTLGYKVNEMLGKNFSEFQRPEVFERDIIEFTRNLAGGSVKEYETTYIAKNGREITLLFNAFPLVNLEGKIIGTQGTAIDITERKLAEKMLKESEKLYRSLFENMLNGFAYCQMHFDDDNRPLDFTYLAVNSTFEKLTGLKNIVGKKVTEVIPGIWENDPELFEIYGRVSRSGRPERFEAFVSSLKMWFLISVYSHERGFFVIVFDVITEQKKAEEEIRKSNEAREQLLKHMTEIRENERALISREIHDQLGQSLTALKLDLNWLQAKMNKTPEIIEKLSGMEDIVTSTIKDVQRISSELRPGILDDLGLAAAIEWYAEEFEKRSNLIIKLDLDEVQVSNEQANLALFRVMQESLTNIIRHAKAKSVQISLHEMNEHIVLDIEDDGIGMSVEKLNSIHSLGLLGMQDRVKQVGGTIDILCGSDAGTKIRICISSNNISPELSKN